MERTTRLTETAAKLFLERNWGNLVDLRPDGTPHVTPVWVDYDGEHVVLNTAVGRAKERHLRRDPRVSMLVLDPNDMYRWVAVTGRAELTDEGADAQIDRLAKKYLGKDEYPNRRPGEQRVSVRIRPEKVESIGI
jgi:PPOX class probable F420-dependent enzyme